MKQGDRFGSRLGMMLAMLGMAVGTGNIWRFPRIAAQNGGGEFLVAWLVFLFLWSIPLILLEFGMGRRVRCGAIKAFIAFMGPRWAWMGAFCVFVTAAILSYYSVVAGWTLRYTVASLTGEVPEASPGAFWEAFTTSPWPVASHGVMIGLATLVVARGVKAIEKAALVLMPVLLLLVLILTVRALLLPGAGAGLSYLFGVDWTHLGEPKIWIEALTQNAWDTGAGWGLVLCYAAYLREREDTALNAFLLPMANNTVSLFAGVMVFCTVFSVLPPLVERAAQSPGLLSGLGSLEERVRAGATFSPQLMQETIFAAGNSGITFTWMPQLFKSMGFGQLFMFLFFLALAFAAFTSLVAMVEVATRAFVDAGMPRERAIRIVGAGGFLLGLPSALWLDVLNNQDWVWGVALMLAGLFFSIAIIVHGIDRFRREQLNHADSDISVGRWWNVVIGVLVPIQAVFLLVWFLYESWRSNPVGWLRPFDPENLYNVGTVLTQFAVVLAALLVANRWIVRTSTAGHSSSESPRPRDEEPSAD